MLLASRQMEPEDFQQLRMEAKQAEDNLKFLTEEADAFYGDIQKQQQAAHQEAAKQCVKTLQDEMPEWSNQLYNDIRGYAVSIGLPQEQVDQYTDPVVIQLINKARLYDEGKKVATVKKTKAATAKKVLRSKKAPDPKASKKAKADKARQDMIARGGGSRLHHRRHSFALGRLTTHSNRRGLNPWRFTRLMNRSASRRTCRP